MFSDTLTMTGWQFLTYALIVSLLGEIIARVLTAIVKKFRKK